MSKIKVESRKSAECPFSICFKTKLLFNAVSQIRCLFSAIKNENKIRAYKKTSKKLRKQELK